MSRLRWLLVFVLALLAPSSALATTHRFAILVGNDVGRADEARLRFAETDAARMNDVLRDLGDFPPGQLVLLRGDSAEEVRRAVVDVNERIRTSLKGPDDRATLVVFYSGHADASALHLGETNLPLRDLEQLVRGSPAHLRLLIVDACRSGALTRVKGATKAPPVALRADLSLASQGIVFLTSSGAGEDAQESDALRGSFFTHHLVSALRGAADRDFDGRITIDEAYEHAYEHTLRDTSTSAVGAQHPTYRYELRGQAPQVLTSPGLAGKRAGTLVFPRGKSYLVFLGNEGGAVVGEVAADASRRALAVRPGTYFLRARAVDHVLEGSVQVTAGTSEEIDERTLKKVAFARMVRKGTGPRDLAHGPRVGYAMRTGLVDGSSLCHGIAGGWAVATRSVEVVPRLSYCQSGFDNEVLEATQREVGAEVGMGYLLDAPVVSFGLGLSVGGGVLQQEFETPGLAPSRASAFARVAAGGRLEIDVGDGLYVDLQADAQTTVFRARSEDGDEGLDAALAFRPLLGLGKWF